MKVAEPLAPDLDQARSMSPSQRATLRAHLRRPCTVSNGHVWADASIGDGVKRSRCIFCSFGPVIGADPQERI